MLMGTAVADTCGVFVSSSKGNDANADGSKGKPYQTLATALAMAKGRAVYACGETFTVTASVTLSSPVTIYGALDCANGWVYAQAKRTQLQAGPDAIPLTLASQATGSSVHDFGITAAAAASAGGSSIAILDDHADLTLQNVDVAAGAGSTGGAGTTQTQGGTPALANGMNGSDDSACNIPGILGGAGGANTCNGVVTNGGAGGNGVSSVMGEPGGTGLPMATPSNGGNGQTSTMPCAPGQQGTPGSLGMPATGARGIGSISASGYQPPTSALAGPGTPGQGGGGGGGARACDVNGMFAGPSGGGGGAGGCGGAPGNPGVSGGSSIGVLVLGANLTLTSVTITTQSGGAGGPGAAGQPGQAGGIQGSQGGPNACSGAPGGHGGPGGAGGGGAGGHSIGIAILGGTLPALTSTTITPGSAGMGGAGGDMTAQTQGDKGMACKVLNFADPTSPTACM
jgi:hypothetical protein